METIGICEAGETVSRAIDQFLTTHHRLSRYRILRVVVSIPGRTTGEGPRGASRRMAMIEELVSKDNFAAEVDIGIIQVDPSLPQTFWYATGFLRSVVASGGAKRLLVLSPEIDTLERLWARAVAQEVDSGLYAMRLEDRQVVFTRALTRDLLVEFLEPA